MKLTNKISLAEREAAKVRYEFEVHADIEASLDYAEEAEILDQQKHSTESEG